MVQRGWESERENNNLELTRQCQKAPKQKSIWSKTNSRKTSLGRIVYTQINSPLMLSAFFFRVGETQRASGSTTGVALSSSRDGEADV